MTFTLSSLLPSSCFSSASFSLEAFLIYQVILFCPFIFKNRHVCGKEFSLFQRGVSFPLGPWEVILSSWNVLPYRPSLFIWGLWAMPDSLTMWFMLNALGQVVSALTSRGWRLTTSLWPNPNKNLGYQGSSELPWLPAICIFSHIATRRCWCCPLLHRERTAGSFAFGTLLDSASCVFSLGWI